MDCASFDLLGRLKIASCKGYTFVFSMRLSHLHLINGVNLLSIRISYNELSLMPC